MAGSLLADVRRMAPFHMFEEFAIQQILGYDDIGI